MKILRCCCAAVLMLGVLGCEEYVLSLKPLCSDESCVSVPGLEGKWASGGQIWTIRPQDTAGYEVRVVDMMSAALFGGRTRHIGDHVFLELKPVRGAEDVPVPSLFAAHLLQASSFMQVKLEGDALSLPRMNAGELKSRLQEHPGLIKHMINDDMLSREMATLMPDMYALIGLQDDRLALTVLDFMEVKDLLAHPEKAQEAQGEPDVRFMRVK